jgi:hypothetical protein
VPLAVLIVADDVVVCADDDFVVALALPRLNSYATK